MGPLRSTTSHRELLSEEARRLAALTDTARVPGGFGWLDESCRVSAGYVHLWITARMTHVAGLALLARLEGPDFAAVLAHGVEALLDGPLLDPECGGWFSRSGSGPVGEDKQGYDHGFVVLAASTAVAAGAPRADVLLQRALEVFDEHFWDADAAMVVETWDRSFSVLSDYRGVNANMHAVEALLAAYDVTGDRELRTRAAAIAERVVGLARGNDYRIPEHAGPDWRPVLEYNADQPADPFRPYGATIGHGLEWSRLLVQLDLAHLDDARRLYDRAVADGWAVDGAPGFVYTTDWAGRPVTRTRMHWVCCEAIRRGDAGRGHRRRALRGRLRAMVGVRPSASGRPRPRLVAPRARRAQPAGELDLAGQAGRLPRRPEHVCSPPDPWRDPRPPPCVSPSLGEDSDQL